MFISVYILWSLQTKVVSSCPRLFFFFNLYSIRLISFIIDILRPLRKEILDHSISKG